MISRRFDHDVLGVLLIICFCFLSTSSNHQILRRFNTNSSSQVLVEESSAVVLGAPKNHSAPIQEQLPDCQVLIVNHGFNFHYEVLESIIALYPLPDASDRNTSVRCNHLSLQFTVSLSQGAVDFQRAKSASWLAYANNTIIQSNKNYYSYVTPGQSRYLHTVVRVPRKAMLIPPLPWEEYAYIIKASCYCLEAMGDPQWLRNDTNRHYCTFHQTCDAYANSTQAMWLNPHHERHFFPSLLPEQTHHDDSASLVVDAENGQQQSQSQPTTPNRTEHNFCVVGSPDRREYSLVSKYLEHHNISDIKSTTRLQFHQFGWGRMPASMVPWVPQYVLQYGIPDYQEYQQKIATTCQAILSLIVPMTHPEYFTGDKKLSGSIVQAAAHRLPIVLHANLAKLYERYIPDAITHGDTQESFNDAIQRLIDRLESQTKEGGMVSPFVVVAAPTAAS